ncbi:MAG TPA: asparagine synthase (glutamine-hydrolyzing) [Gemmatimonadaceae bacterium]
MCGIFGFVGNGSHAASLDLSVAIAALHHRGPDDHGTYRDLCRPTACVFGHTRLSIIDTSAGGHQPMTTADGRFTLVYNGEIYNFAQLRRELEAHGDTFRSLSDTEVLVAGYARWGQSVAPRLRGMFAFAVWDAVERKLFLARDHFGVKPLYYVQTSDGLTFASEVRALLRTGSAAPRLNAAALASYFSFGSVYEPETIIEGVRSFPAATFATYRNGEMAFEKYWSLPLETEDTNFADGVERIATALRQGVSEELVADVPLGVFLSGGVDSSVLVALAASAPSNRPLKTFNVSFGEEKYDEARFAAEVAARFRCDHQQVHLPASRAVAEIDAAVRSLDQPSADGVNIWFVSKAAREAGLSVALSGVGGDELFAGYGTFRSYARARRLPSATSMVARLPWRRSSDPFGTMPQRFQKLESVIEAAGDPFLTYAALRSMFTPRQVHALAPDLNRTAIERGGSSNASGTALPVGDSVNEYSLLEQQNYLRNTVLRDTDAMSMAHSLEVRVPLLNHRVAELLMRIPGKLKLGRTNKPLLHSVAGNLPRGLAARKKMGFILPMEIWLRGPLRERARATLDRGASRIAALDPGALVKLWRAFEKGSSYVSWARIWTLIALIEWCEANNVVS